MPWNRLGNPHSSGLPLSVVRWSISCPSTAGSNPGGQARNSLLLRKDVETNAGGSSFSQLVFSNLSRWRWPSSRKTCICCWQRAGSGVGAAAWTPASTDPLQMPSSECSGNVFTSEAWERMLYFGSFPSLFGWELLAGIGAELMLFNMLLGILFRITPSVRASECKWIYQFLKYQLKKKYACDIKNLIQAPCSAQLLFKIYHWKRRIISKACSKFLKKSPLFRASPISVWKQYFWLYRLNINRYNNKAFCWY